MEKPQLIQWGFKDEHTFIRSYNQNIKLEIDLREKYNRLKPFLYAICSLPTVSVVIFVIAIFITPVEDLLNPLMPEDTTVKKLIKWLLVFSQNVGIPIIVGVSVLMWKYTFNPLARGLAYIITKPIKQKYEKLLDVQAMNYCNALRQYYDWYINKLAFSNNHVTFEYWEYDIINKRPIGEIE